MSSYKDSEGWLPPDRLGTIEHFRRARYDVAAARLTPEQLQPFVDRMTAGSDPKKVLAEMEDLAAKNPDPNPRKIPFPYRPQEPLKRYPS